MLFMAFGWSNDGYDPGALDLFYQGSNVPNKGPCMLSGNFFMIGLHVEPRSLIQKGTWSFLLGRLMPLSSLVSYTSRASDRLIQFDIS